MSPASEKTLSPASEGKMSLASESNMSPSSENYLSSSGDGDDEATLTGEEQHQTHVEDVLDEDGGPHQAHTEDVLEEEDESVAQWKTRLIQVLGQMMFVSGETAEPSAETTWIIEEIVRQQVVEMVSVPRGTIQRHPLSHFPSSSPNARLWRPGVDLAPSRRTTSSS